MTSPPRLSALPGFKEFLVGESGTGKTHVTRTLLKSGIQPIVLATEPGFRALAPCDDPGCEICKGNRDEPPIPFAYVPPTAGSIDILIEQAKKVQTMSQDQLCRINDLKRANDYNQYVEVLNLVKSFTDSTGKNWGGVLTWNTDRALVFDGLSSLGQMAMDLYCGRRPLYDRPDYQIAQRSILNFITLLTTQRKCHVIVIGHTGMGENEKEQRNRITVNTIGQKLAPDLPRFFDDMPHAEREGNTFSWSTATTSAVTKARNLPYKTGLKPDYKQIIESWKRAGGVILPTSQETVK